MICLSLAQPENILLFGRENPVVKLIDFGTARDLSSPELDPTVCASSPEFCGMLLDWLSTVNYVIRPWAIFLGVATSHGGVD